jgi:hypothetical protein
VLRKEVTKNDQAKNRRIGIDPTTRLDRVERRETDTSLVKSTASVLEQPGRLEKGGPVRFWVNGET